MPDQTSFNDKTPRTDKEKADDYNRLSRQASYSSYRFTENRTAASGGGSFGEPDGPRKTNKAPITRKRKIGAAAAIICGLVLTSLVGVTAIRSFDAAKTGLDEAVGEFRDEVEGGSKKDPPVFDGHAGVSDLPEKEEEAPDNETAPEDKSRLSDESSADLTVAEVAEQCMPSMAIITTTTVQEMQDFFGGGTQQYEGEASGTGIIIEKTDKELFVVTNNHVVSDSETISVGFMDGSAWPAEILGRDVAEDLAVLSVSLEGIPQETLQAIKVIEIGDSDDCRVGEPVVAIGNALGYGQSVSAGIISALNREVVVDGVNHTLIQTDAAINPGNSGGALLNMRGQLIGINEVKYAQTTVEGMGYAIPMAKARPIIDRLMNREVREKVPEDERSYLGVNCVTIPSSYIRQGYPAGVYISEVIAGQAAEKAGIIEGDIISSIDGYSVTTADELINELEYYSAGSMVELTVLRLDEVNQQAGFRMMTVEVELGSRAEAHIDDQPAAGGQTEDGGQADGETQNPGETPENDSLPAPEDGQNQMPFGNWEDFFDLPFFR